MGRDPNTSPWVQHLAPDVDSVETLVATRARLQAAGIEVVELTDHTLVKSICFFDPNGHRLELAADAGTSDMLKRLDQVKTEMLEEGARTKRAPRQAVWLHDGSAVIS